MHAFWIALFIVFIAEMGDKTQFMTLSFSTRYRTSTVVAGVFLGTLVISLISALLGEALGGALPFFWINLLAGIIFIGFGFWSLRGKESKDEKPATQSRLGPLMTIAVTFFVAELGDRTMLATIMIASRERNFVGVWLGSTSGLALSNMLAIIVGRVMGKRLPEKALRYGTALIFIASGVLALIEAWRTH
jgi:putative Ca2+/H+ antiporter (TMEM165/GDT1 family)